MAESKHRKEKYSKPTVIIHWVTAILIIALFGLGRYTSSLEPADKMQLIQLHAALGMLVFILTIARSVLFFKSERPEPLDTGSNANNLLAKGIHRAFYALLILISFSGTATLLVGGYFDAITSSPIAPDLISPRDEIIPLVGHRILGYIIMLLFVLHVAGVVRYNIKHKTNAVERMT